MKKGIKMFKLLKNIIKEHMDEFKTKQKINMDLGEK